MLVETQDLLTLSNAAWTAGVAVPRFQALVAEGRIRPFVSIDGIAFFHRAEALALRRFRETMAGKPPTPPPPRTQELF